MVYKATVNIYKDTAKTEFMFSTNAIQGTGKSIADWFSDAGVTLPIGITNAYIYYTATSTQVTVDINDTTITDYDGDSTKWAGTREVYFDITNIPPGYVGESGIKGIYIGEGVGSDHSAMQGPCPSGFHIPMESERQTIKTAVETRWSGNGAGQVMALATYLKMPLAGNRTGASGDVSSQSASGSYWTCTVSGNSAKSLYITSQAISINTSARRACYSLRPFKDIPVIPNSTRTVEYQGTGDAGIYSNSTLGLISLSTDGTNWITIADKNVGATVVYSFVDALSEANCGKYFQRGNNYGFPFTGTLADTSTTRVSTEGYGPGNYYSSSTYIYYSSSPYDWSNPKNDNLWGGVTGITKFPNVREIYKGDTKIRPIGQTTPSYLCFTANSVGSTVQLTKTGSPTSVTLETSTDGTNWTTYTIGNTITLNNIGDKVYWRNTSETDTGFSTSSSNYYQFVMTGSISGSGDINYLLNKNSTTTLTTTSCYNYLFYQCTSLTTTPDLPATTLTNSCYASMFRGCSNLTTATPSLPATTLTTSCYANMFQLCGSLTATPSLPATTMANYCYSGMFRQCTSLTTVPSLAITTLGSNCCANMFYGCTGLTALPSLSATTMANSCYYGMFQGCSNIKLSTTQTGDYQTEYRIPASGTGTSASSDLTNMFKTTGGTFTGTPTINTTYYTSNTVV